MRTLGYLAIASAVMLTSTAAFAESCKMQAGEKKLAGAALKSFMTKCSSDATTACTKQADDKKLAGAARTSFTKKCVTDATGS